MAWQEGVPAVPIVPKSASPGAMLACYRLGALDPDHVIVQVSAPTAEEAAVIGRLAVERRLAASAQVAPIRTIYRWRGQLIERDEHVVTLFTRTSVFEELAACVRENHSYEVPQIVALPLVAGWPPFLAWLDDNTGPEQP